MSLHLDPPSAPAHRITWYSCLVTPAEQSHVLFAHVHSDDSDVILVVLCARKSARVKISDFMKVFKMVIWVRVVFIYVKLCMKLLDFLFL